MLRFQLNAEPGYDVGRDERDRGFRSEAMQFSMKWVLLGMAYVAVAAAAFSQGHWIYADLLWGATFLAVCFAILIIGMSTGVRRAAAAGFTLFALAFALCLQVAPGTVPTKRILSAAVAQEFPVYYPPPMPVPAVAAAPVLPYAGEQTVDTFLDFQIAQPAVIAPMTAYGAPRILIEQPFSSKLRAANTVGAMLFGLIGGWLGAMAFRRQRITCSETGSRFPPTQP
jgi:hypothetical protein